ncbi:class I ribonucleotide reductase maintenance protein YfaE [Buchnera aphidicola]|uniref:class I ribonucleotide reductase maintenance protein YfaE n=1 Tax=Buchnera aphidicola TaxID=9 RepID=UPI0022384617|nr:class I ribonucleotide reductase maintenance protein YfaE [Buchnera aphidicola]MCW5197743.1 2Fe-2S iron-sulfur cluster binding domain-containing protein [Buchnera aphidicola (Chaitophorus viminalis)]
MKKNVIKIYKKKIKIISKRNQSPLLQILIENNIKIDYQCKDGYCGTCKVILITGKICYLKKNPIAMLQKNEIVTCCCIVLSNITIKLHTLKF